MFSLLDLDRQLEHPITVITTDDDLFEFMCDMGMKWREQEGLPPIDRKRAGELYMLHMKTEAMEYQFP